MPMLAEIGTCRLSIHSGDVSASVMLEATSEARAGSQFGNTMTNSSPLRRPSRSDGWMRARSRLVNSISSASPAECPSVSLTSLK